MRTRKNHKVNDKQKQIIIIVLVIVLLVSVGITVWAVFFRDTTPVLAPDYAPQQTEENAQPVDDAYNGEKLAQPQGGGAVNLTYSKDVTIDLSDNTAHLMFANPNQSNQDIMIQILVQDTVIVQSGLLEPGYQVEELNLFDNAKLSSGQYDGKFVVLYYQKDTGEKAMLNTEIPLTITVEE